jgi:hypothetical protein
MVNLDFILFLAFVAAVLITHLAKRQRIPPPKRDFPENASDEIDPAAWQQTTSRDERLPTHHNPSIENDWGSSSSYEYEPAPVVSKPKVVIRRPLPQKAAVTPLRSTYKGIDSGSALPIRATAAKVAKRTSPFADHFRQKRSIQLAVVDRVVLGPCRADAPYGEHQ